METKILDDDLGFFFSCYKEKDAVDFCISNIRNYYKNNPIYLSSDGGYDFSYLQDDNLKFKLYDDVLGYVNNPEYKDKDKLINCCEEFLFRMNESINFCKKDYIIYYEPDILLRGKIRINYNLKLNGSYANTIENFVLDKIKEYNPNNLNQNFGSCGGSIINCESFVDVYQKTNKDILKDLIYTDPRISNCDYLLTVLFSIFGYKYDINFDFIEAKRDKWENSEHSIVHQYHHNYKINYNGKYK